MEIANGIERYAVADEGNLSSSMACQRGMNSNEKWA